MNTHHFYSYNIISSLLEQFGLIIKHGKTEVFHFTRPQGLFNSLLLDFSYIGDPILCPKDFWKYLGFIFVRKLLFHQYIKYYTNKALSTVKYIKMLRNSVHRLLPYQKCLLYRTFVLSITFYSFLLQHYNKVLLFYPLNKLNKIQRQAILWILDVFYTSPTIEIEAITSLIPIHLHLQKLSDRHQLQISILSYNHAIKLLLERRHMPNSQSYHLLLENMASKQQKKIKSFIVDTSNYLNGIFPSFDSLNSKFHPGSRLIDIFSSHFSFHKANHHNKETRTAYCNKLNKLILSISLESNTVIIVLDASIKNNIAISITHIHSLSSPIKKILHHTINITSIETKLFAIRCKVSQAIQITNISYIIIITDALHTAQKIFDPTIYPFQLQSIIIFEHFL